MLFVPPSQQCCWFVFHPAPVTSPRTSAIEWSMEHILQTYASSSEDGVAEEDTPGNSALGELPIELRTIFADSGEISYVVFHLFLVPWDMPTCRSPHCGLPGTYVVCSSQLAAATSLCPMEDYGFICIYSVHREITGHMQREDITYFGDTLLLSICIST